MLNLTSTGDKIQLTSNGDGALEVHASWVDVGVATIAPGNTNSAPITTSTTTDIVPAPAASTERNVRLLSVFNTHPNNLMSLAVKITDGSNAETLWAGTLLAGEFVICDSSGRWVQYNSQGLQRFYDPSERLKQVDVQAFEDAGTYWWVKPKNITATITLAVLFGAGGGGGGGVRNPVNGSIAGGGGGGGGGAHNFRYMLARDLGVFEKVIVGAGGAGGKSGVSGTAGAAGGNTTFGTTARLFAGGGGPGTGTNACGGGGGGGTASAGRGGVGIAPNGGDPRPITLTSGANNGCGSSGSQGGGQVNNSSEFGGGGGGAGVSSPKSGGGSLRGGGGGGGGGATSGASSQPVTVQQPGNGGASNQYTFGGGGSAGTSGATPTPGGDGADGGLYCGGQGGGGGGSITATGAGASGGRGGKPGGGGGGGGASVLTNGGVGGRGGDGAAYILTW